MLKVGQPVVFIQPLDERPYSYVTEGIPQREYPALVYHVIPSVREAILLVLTPGMIYPRTVSLEDQGLDTSRSGSVTPVWRHVE